MAVKLVAVVSLTQVVRAHLAETNKGKNIFCLDTPKNILSLFWRETDEARLEMIII